jgi:hypothetical protein
MTQRGGCSSRGRRCSSQGNPWAFHPFYACLRPRRGQNRNDRQPLRFRLLPKGASRCPTGRARSPHASPAVPTSPASLEPIEPEPQRNRPSAKRRTPHERRGGQACVWRGVHEGSEQSWIVAQEQSLVNTYVLVRSTVVGSALAIYTFLARKVRTRPKKSA